MRAMRIEEFDYELPQDLIAQFPAAHRSASRLLHLDGATGRYTDHSFVDLPLLLRSGDLLVLNDTKVIKAPIGNPAKTAGEGSTLILGHPADDEVCGVPRRAAGGGQSVANVRSRGCAAQARESYMPLTVPAWTTRRRR